VAAAMADLRELHRLRHVMSVPALIEEVLSRRLLRATAYDDWRPREAHRRYRFVAEQARALPAAGAAPCTTPWTFWSGSPATPPTTPSPSRPPRMSTPCG